MIKNIFMKITDLDGLPLTITNLEEAIAQAELFKDFKFETPGHKRLEKELTKYWTDIFDKLMKIKNGSEPP